MAIIYSYPVASGVEAGDLLIGTDITGKQTKNFSISSILDLSFKPVGTDKTLSMFGPASTLVDSLISQDDNGLVFIGSQASGTRFTNTSVSTETVTGTNLFINNITTSDGGNVLIQGNVIIGDAATDMLQIASKVSDSTGDASTAAGQILLSNAAGQLVWGDITSPIAGGVAGEIAVWTSETTLGTAPIKLGAGSNSLILNDLTQSTASGNNSVAMGLSTIASGDYSTAIGRNTTASGTASTAMGSSSIASGNDSTAIGRNSVAKGAQSFAAGYNALADEGPMQVGSTIALGTDVEATHHNSVAMGNKSRASGEISTAMGFDSHASGRISTAMGRSTAAGEYSTSTGYLNQATGDRSTAMGNESTASGVGAFSIGYQSIAGGNNSFAGGGNSEAPDPGGHAIGANSIAFGIGAKSSAFSIALGNGTRAGVDSGGISTGVGSVAIGNQAIAEGSNAFASGTGTNASGNSSTAMGSGTSAAGDRSFTAGVGNLASGVSTTALGSVTVASGNNSFACGDNTTASGIVSFAAGKGTIASGNGSIAMGGIGTGTSTASGEASAVFGGLQNTANGTNSTILGGQKNTIDVNSGDSGIIGGEDNNMTAGSTNSILLGGIGLIGGGINQTAVGVANVSRNDAKFIVGVGSYDGPTSITRENGFVVTDNGQIELDKYVSNFLNSDYQFPVLNVDGSGRVAKGNLVDMLPNVPPEMSSVAITFQPGSNENLSSNTKGIVIASWTGASGSATATLPQSSNNLNKLITIVTAGNFGSAGGSNVLGIKPGFGDTINDVAAPSNVVVLDKGYESAEFYATSQGWIMLRKTII